MKTKLISENVESQRHRPLATSMLNMSELVFTSVLFLLFL